MQQNHFPLLIKTSNSHLKQLAFNLAQLYYLSPYFSISTRKNSAQRFSKYLSIAILLWHFKHHDQDVCRCSSSLWFPNAHKILQSPFIDYFSKKYFFNENLNETLSYISIENLDFLQKISGLSLNVARQHQNGTIQSSVK